MTEFSKVGERVGREVSVQFYSAEEFGDKLKAEDPVALSILANPVLT